MYGYWQSPLKELVYGLKYYRVQPLADILGDCLATTATKFFQYPGVDPVLIPVPLHRGRLWDRGFNQAQLLANYVGQQLNYPVINALVRRKFTQPQFGLSRSSRQDNLQGAFRIRNNQKTALIGRTVLLVDDIVTTGATLNECAKILKQGGAKEVWGLVLAKA
jgi:ComF family protein